MASVRFPEKILFPIHGLPMVEHVRRRALLSNMLSDVIVATCDELIASTVKNYGGKVIMTANTHKNGTARVAEAIKKIECTHVILLQGDEPLLLPNHIDIMIKEIKKNKKENAWNITGPIENKEELDRRSFVKCVVNKNEDILYCFRRTPLYSSFEIQKKFIRKILGIIAYEKHFLIKLNNLSQTNIEEAEFIEQMRIIENKYSLKSIPVISSIPSVNEPHEIEAVLNSIKTNEEQKQLLELVLKNDRRRI
jgi:3-deoxy-manno-octulosonate cytidylyltransferase (CMP-KDO synthetase)